LCDVSAEAVQFLATLPDETVTLTGGMDVMRRVAGAMGKLHLLAEQQTLESAMHYLNTFFDEYAVAAKSKGAYEMNAVEIQTAEQRMKLLSSDPVILSNPLAAEERMKLRNQILALSNENLALTMELIDYCPKAVDRLNPAATNVTLGLRRELGLLMNETWYRDKQRRNQEINEVRCRPLTAAMKANLDKIKAGRP